MELADPAGIAELRMRPSLENNLPGACAAGPKRSPAGQKLTREEGKASRKDLAAGEVESNQPPQRE